jgi:hypothetical protein
MPDIAYDTHPNVRSAKYLIVESRTCCPQCSTVTKVFAFALPAGYESLCVDDDTPDDESGTWEVPGLTAVVSYVEYLPVTVAERIRTITPHYRVDLDNETGETFWKNHCEHCGVQMMEEELHGEPEGPFGFMPREGLEAIQWYQVSEPFEARAGAESHDVKPLDS